MRRVAERNGRREDERGVVLLISVVMMVMLLLFASIVIDVGQVMIARRQDQSTVDVAVVAGAMNRFDEAELAATVLDVINDNVDSPMALADLNTCAAETLPTDWSTYPTYNCLAHNRSYTEIRLRLPEREINTAFGMLAGIDTISHSAFAQAGDRTRGDVLPFAISATAGTYECLKSGAGNVPDDDCSGATSGNFGPVIFGLWGNELTGTTKDCLGKDQFMTNLAQGIDHDLSIYGTAPHVLPTAQVVDTDSCGTTPAPNAMKTYTGNTPQNLYDGILSDTTFPDGSNHASADSTGCPGSRPPRSPTTRPTTIRSGSSSTRPSMRGTTCRDRAGRTSSSATPAASIPTTTTS